VLGLPRQVVACLFDLDGVLTQTARVHDAAWTEMFDAYLRTRSTGTGEPFVPFDPDADYNRYVDGKPRLDGVRSFLASRGITLPEGDEHDPPGTPSVHGLGRLKNDIVLRRIREHGVDVYPGSVRYLHAAREAGLRRAVVSSSANCHDVLVAAGLDDLIEARVDGQLAAREGLRGKPAPDTFLAGARLLGVEPAGAAVFEDALAGVEAGRAGGFGYVVGVDRVDHADELRAAGADAVVADLAELLDEPADPDAAAETARA
jgi:beta-phosphoglucomutase family hydrolase